ncbi:MAG: putative porin [Tenacibaculum sp.]
MKKNILLLFVSLSTVQAFSQITNIDKSFTNQEGLYDISKDSLNKSEISVKLSGKTKYTDYKIISHKNDTTIIDTTLTIQKYYKFNFLRKDNFELLAFHNQGQTFNRLAYDFSNKLLFADIGFRAKQFNYVNIEDVKYYKLPTPSTEIMYRTGLEQGQVLDALFALNFSERFNVALGYKGLRSLGAYRRSLSSTGNFVFSINYQSSKKQYFIKAHAVNQDFTNQESGGLTNESLNAFLTNDSNFSNNRGRLDVNLNDAESVLQGKRLYIEQSFQILSSKDSLNKKDFSNLKIGHLFTRFSKYFEFKQDAASNFFDQNNISGSVSNKTNYLLYNNELFLDFNSKYILGRFKVKTSYTSYNYGYENLQNKLVNINKNRLRGRAISVGANWNGKIKNFDLNLSGFLTPGSGRLAGHNMHAEISYKKDSVVFIKAKAELQQKTPNFNFLLHQSSYDKFNWQNNFAPLLIRVLSGELNSKWLKAYLDLTNIDNYAYFDEQGLPRQYSGNINYIKAKILKEVKVGKFALNNTLMYQKVLSGNSVLRVPYFITRNTLYYSDNWFKGNSLYVQLGASLKYFTRYKSNVYNPLLGEFTLQNTVEIGYPSIDLFFNGRVRRTRIYFKADNFSALFFKKNYLSAPTYPYRDFVIRFGLVWNWFI